MSCLPLDHEALALLRRLRPQEALQVLQQAWMGLHFVNVACGQRASKFSCLTVNAMSSMILAQCHNVVAFKGWTKSTCKHSYLLLFTRWPLRFWSGSSLKGRLSPSADIFCCFATGTGEHPRNQQQYVKLHQNQGAGWVWDSFHGTRHGFALCLELEGQIKVGRSGQYR